MPAADTGPLTVGLLGLGVIGQVHLRTLAALVDATVVLAVDPSPTARETARACPAYDGLDAVLADLRSGGVEEPTCSCWPPRPARTSTWWNGSSATPTPTCCRRSH